MLKPKCRSLSKVKTISRDTVDKENNKLKITFEYPDREFSASIHEDSAMPEVVETLKGLLIAVGFHPDTVKEYIGEV